MLTLYHGATSVCSQKVRFALFEKNLDWDSQLLDLRKGEQFDPQFIKLNPEAVVPVIVHDELVLRESSAIIDYLERLSDHNRLRPRADKAHALMMLWLVRTIEIHAATNTLSFASVFREDEMAKYAPEQIEERLARMPNRQAAAKRRDLFANGVESVFVASALRTFDQVFKDMQVQLAGGDWLTGGAFGLADIALIAYIDRLDRLAFSGLWRAQYPAVDAWLARMKARPAYQAAIADYLPAQQTEAFLAAGRRIWPSLAAQMAA